LLVPPFSARAIVLMRLSRRRPRGVLAIDRRPESHGMLWQLFFGGNCRYRITGPIAIQIGDQFPDLQYFTRMSALSQNDAGVFIF